MFSIYRNCEKIYKTFCVLTSLKARRRWLWTAFKQDTFSIQRPEQYLIRLIEKEEVISFFVTDVVGEKDKLWFSGGKVEIIQTIIEEGEYSDKFYIISKKLEWLIFINHHDILIATGQIMPNRLKEFEEDFFIRLNNE